MKKLLVVLLAVTLVASFAVGCTSSKDGGKDAVTYEDGVYFAQEDAFASSGYKYFVVLTVADGKISDAKWGGTNIQPLGNKKTLSEDGKYGMDWHSQAVAAEKWLIENQDPALFDDKYTDDEGHTDALETDAGTAVSIHVVEFFDLAKKALASDPVAKGEYTTPDDFVALSTIPVDKNDPAYKPENAWEYRLDLIIVNGTIMDSNMNAVFDGEFSDATTKFYKVDKEGKPDEKAPLSKKELGLDYGIDWAGNAEKVDAFVEESQKFEVNYTDDKGHTDTITGVSIHVNEYEELFKEATGK